ncbi:MAG TPA: hypothetical protein VLA52_14590 [Thermohalobaculum sp.]|nr:hypothetical protein [Thermohalobaculum sp.]
MTRTLRLILGTIAVAALITGAAALSAWPSYSPVPQGSAMLKLSLSHGGVRNCRQLTEAELAKLPPNMRRKEICDRKRAPLTVELVIDGARVYHRDLPPSGLSGDGPSRVYEKFVLPAGPHSIAVRLRDTLRAEGFDYQAVRDVELAPGQNFVIDFSPVTGEFVFN